jgi:hypothetical protein
MKTPFFYLMICFLLAACQNDTKIKNQKSDTDNFRESITKDNDVVKKQFELIPSSQSNINFNNIIIQDSIRNTLNYTYMFNGGGVAVGDVNNDGLSDIFFTGNQVSDRLYLNKGGLVFEDISLKAKVGGSSQINATTWSTGVTMVDINNDGWLDIYVCRGGPNLEAERENLLYVNNGDATFTELAKDYGINDKSFSTQAVFFDYDNDDDLDLYVVNHPVYFDEYTAGEVQEIIKNKKALLYYSGKFYENMGSKSFVEKTEQTGLMRLGYGLGVNASDLNNDGWVDLYVSNDFSTPDFMMINQKNKTFKDVINTATKHISYYGMGNDIADINNDGLLDIFVADMTAEDHFRSKTLMPSMDPSIFRGLTQGLGYQAQYMFNTMQLNNGNGTFSEVGQLLGVHKTDWSWATNFADFDNDGDNDLFVSNGWMQDTKNNDFLTKYRQRKRTLNVKKIPPNEIMQWVNQIPSFKTVNYIFSNEGNLKFEKKATAWGLVEPSFSNGAAIADLDQDGDLEIIVNNIGDEAFIYKNNAVENNNNHYLKIQLKGSTKNNLALNAKVKLYTTNGIQYKEHTLTRGYASSSDPILHFGLGETNTIDRLEVTWLDGTTHVEENIKADQTLLISRSAANQIAVNVPKKKKTLLNKQKNKLGLDFKHQEFLFDEYAKEILLPHSQSSEGPLMSVADVNNDGLDDIFIGGAHQQSSVLYIQKNNSKFEKSNINLFKNDAFYEDIGATFFDLENDGDLDLYIVSGGSGEMIGKESYLQDRLYLNDGKGNFSATKNIIPAITGSGKVVRPCDFDHDGDIDLFVGGRVIPGRYPSPPKSYLLLNDGGTFKDVISQYAPELENIGMITDAIWSDIDGDKKDDLIVVGEWMPISIFKNQENTLKLYDKLNNSVGWWQSIEQIDVDKDGDFDYVVGNIGLNNKFINKEKGQTLQVFGNDFDNSGSMDIVLAKNYNGKLVPVRGKECSSQQMPFINQNFTNYESFANSDLITILGAEKLAQAVQYEAQTFQSCILKNNNGKFSLVNLPRVAQIAPIKDILVKDINKDGHEDLILVGNLYGTEVETIRYDSGTGYVMLSDRQGNFNPIPNTESGFFSSGDTRNMSVIRLANKEQYLLVSNNNGELDVYRLL